MKKDIYLLSLFILLLPTVNLVGQNKENIYSANTKEISYVGRTVAYDNGSVSFDWSGTYFTTTFSGGYFAIKVSDTGANYYNVYIDNKFHSIVKTTGSDTLVKIVTGYDKKDHIISLQKRTEGEHGETTIHKIILDAKGKLTPVASIRKRHIEYIGDSLTTGFGVEGTDREAPFTPENEDCNDTYACMIARIFDADYTLIAHSGRGVVRNYGDSLRVSQYPMSERMMFTFDSDPQSKWDFRSYTPDIVVVNVGSNDFSTKPNPYKEVFTAAYRKIINQLRQNYGKEVVILCVGPRVGEPAFSYIKELVGSMEDNKLFFRGSVHGTYNSTTDMGEAWHPNAKGQQKIAMAIAPYISTIMNWDIDADKLQLNYNVLK